MTNTLLGVFSYSSFFSWLHKERAKTDVPRFTKKEARDIDRRFINSPVVNFKFNDEDMEVNEIPELFNRETRRRKRLDCLLLTKDAEKTKDITGIITPCDLGDIRGF